MGTLTATTTAILICTASGAFWSLLHFAIGLPTVEGGAAILKSSRNLLSFIGRAIAIRFNRFETKESARLAPAAKLMLLAYTKDWALEDFEKRQTELRQYEAYAIAEAMKTARPNPYKAAGVCFVCFASWGGFITVGGIFALKILPLSLLWFFPAFSAYVTYVAVRMRFDQ